MMYPSACSNVAAPLLETPLRGACRRQVLPWRAPSRAAYLQLFEGGRLRAAAAALLGAGVARVSTAGHRAPRTVADATERSSAPAGVWSIGKREARREATAYEDEPRGDSRRGEQRRGRSDLEGSADAFREVPREEAFRRGARRGRALDSEDDSLRQWNTLEGDDPRGKRGRERRAGPREGSLQRGRIPQRVRRVDTIPALQNVVPQLRESADLLMQNLGFPSKQAIAMAKEIQRFGVARGEDDPTGSVTKRWSRRLIRGLRTHPGMRQTLAVNNGASLVLEELERRAARHDERFNLIRQQHDDVSDGLDGDIEGYSEVAAFMGNEWWLRKAHSNIITAIDEFYLLSPEQLQRGHPRWAFQKKAPLPEGWMSYNLKGKTMWWNPETKRMQRQAPQLEDAREAPPPREPPVQLLDIGSSFNRFKDHEYFVDAYALDLQPAAGSEDVFKADFFDVPIVEPEPGQEGQRFLLGGDGSLQGIVAGSFDVVVISMVLSYLSDAKRRIDMIARARRCLRDDRGLLFIVEAGSALPEQSWYKKDAAAEWSHAMEAAGFKVRMFSDKIAEQQKFKNTLQWTLETAPMNDAPLEPLVTAREISW
eukprot:TRINITY_DN1541_c1_g1_i1.p1 TRINITY_DN1541_c1_g1~~TRINITY_DN1541_c1_g1_i1.p1  ORF type:complete len:595 (-),score=139.76 TRINITY_DN1541_c1_g1_i1:8-1792(-)